MCGLPLDAAAAAVRPTRPNVVVITTDDQTIDDMASMPQTRALIGARGVTFDQSVVSLSQCCPSRATFLTGQYAHNHGVRSTNRPFGGFWAFDDSESLAVWLQRAGYATALVGKYLNGYASADRHYVPPGWTDWHGLLGPSTYQFFGFSMNDDGAVRSFPGQYQTDVLTSVSEDVIQRHAGRRPFFLWTTYVAPHIGGPRALLEPRRPESTVASPFFDGALLGRTQPRPPSYDEADVTDKPRAIRRLPRMGPRMKADVAASWRERQQSLLSVDDGVARIVRALRETGVLDDTLLVFTSDNGYMVGEHRVRSGKVLPYEPSIRVPLLMRGPGIPAGEHRSQLVWNGDLAPTIAAATGAEPTLPLDGQSLWPVLRDPEAPGAAEVLLEGPPKGASDSRPRFTGLRTPRWAYVEHALTGERELYDLESDPFELRNVAGSPAVAEVEAELAARLEAERHCAGAACRR